MDNKLIAFATALALSTSVCVAPAITVSAAPAPLQTALMSAFDGWVASDEYVAPNGTILKKSTDKTHIVVSSVNTGDYSAFPNDLLVEANVTIDDKDDYSVYTRSTTNLETKVILDMSKVGVVYSDYTTLADNLAAFSAEIDDDTVKYAQVKGKFTINVTIPSGLTFADSTFTSTPLKGFSFASGSLNVSDIFTETKREYKDGVLSITIETNKSKLDLDKYFNGASTPDIVLAATLQAPTPTSSQKTYTIKGSMTGDTTITSRAGVKLGYVEYRAIQKAGITDDANDEIIGTDYIDISETAVINRRSGGGGGGSTPTVKPTTKPTVAPTTSPTVAPTTSPTVAPTTSPTVAPTTSPTVEPTRTPSSYVEPTLNPNPSAAPAPEEEKVPVVLDKEDTTKYIYGYPEGDVRPENNISRAEVAVIFYRLLTDESRDKVATEENKFTDVNKDTWYNKEVSTMANAGVLTGYDDNSFKGDKHITRAELATIAARFSNLTYTGEETKFTDIEDHWAQDYINLAAEIGYVNGYDDGTFNPDEYISRAETITLINRVIERNHAPAPSDYDIKWVDNTIDKWYYHAVQKATNDIQIEIK